MKVLIIVGLINYRMIKGIFLLIFGFFCCLNINSQSNFSDSSKSRYIDNSDSICKCSSTALRIDPKTDSMDLIGITIVDESAKFNDGDLNDFRIYIQDCISQSKINSIDKEDKVIVEFYIDTTGTLIDSKVLRCNNYDLAISALRCINKSPRWIPAKQNGKGVKQRFVMPIASYIDKK